MSNDNTQRDALTVTPYAPPNDKAVRSVGKRGDALKRALKRAEKAKQAESDKD